MLPLADDVLRFVTFLEKEESRLVEDLRQNFSYASWKELSKVLLCSLIVFNRKRVGDVDKIPLSCYDTKCDASPDSAIYESLDQSERLIASSYTHFYTRGKKHSVVPVMVPKRQIPSLDLIIKLRPLAKVTAENPYLFGKQELSFFNGSHALRYLSERSGIENHNLLRSTTLRKQIATMSQVMNMKSGDLEVLAGYLGHTIDVHRSFYRCVGNVPCFTY